VGQFFKYKEEVGFVLANILLATLCFFLGVIYGSRQSLTVEDPKIFLEENESQDLKVSENLEDKDKKQNEILFVASKKGKVYHFPWCPGAKAIKEDNKIYFSSREEAEKAGYRPAKNCPGL